MLDLIALTVICNFLLTMKDVSLDGVAEEIYDRVDEDDLGLYLRRLFDFKSEEERRWREDQARLRWNPESYLLAQVFNNCPLQGDQELTHKLGRFFPWIFDNVFGQAPHVFWHGEDACPQLLEYWASDKFEKLFVPVDRSNATSKEVIRLLNGLTSSQVKEREHFQCNISAFCSTIKSPNNLLILIRIVSAMNLSGESSIRQTTPRRRLHLRQQREHCKASPWLCERAARGLDWVGAYLHAEACWRRQVVVPR